MSSARSVGSAFVVMVVCCLVSVIMAFALGMSLDQIMAGFLNAGMYNITNPEWSGFYASLTTPMVNMLYFIIIGMPFVGIILFVLTLFKSRIRERDEWAE